MRPSKLDAVTRKENCQTVKATRYQTQNTNFDFFLRLGLDLDLEKKNPFK